MICFFGHGRVLPTNCCASSYPVNLTSEWVKVTIILFFRCMNDQYEPIAIVGMGVRVPEADDVDAFWRILEEKRDMTRDIPKERFSSEFWCSREKMKGSSVGVGSWFHAQISFRGGFIDNIRDFDAPFFNLSANEARELDPQIRLLLETAWFAMEDAGVVLGDATTNGGVFIGHMTHVRRGGFFSSPGLHGSAERQSLQHQQPLHARQRRDHGGQPSQLLLQPRGPLRYIQHSLLVVAGCRPFRRARPPERRVPVGDCRRRERSLGPSLLCRYE